MTTCQNCHQELTGRSTKWCSKECRCVGWRSSNRQHRNAKARDYYANNPTRVAEASLRRALSPAARASRLLWLARARAKRDGREFSITKADVVIPAVCPALGEPLVLTSLVGTHDFTPSIDRLDNRLGYVPGNVRVISFRANRIKGDSSIEEFEKVFNYMKGAGCH